MRRLAPMFVIALAVAACSGDATTATTAATPSTTTTVAESATTTDPTTTDPTTADKTTTTASTGGAALAFDTVADTPPAVFESFSASMTLAMVIDDTALEQSAEGVWTTDAFECTVTTDLGGLAFTQSIIATPETLWLDDGNGYEPSPLLGGEAQAVISSCPTSPLYWTDFTTDGLGQVSGEEELIDGRTAVKADITELISLVGGFALVPGMEEATIHDMTMWIDKETGAVLALTTDLEVGTEFLGDVGVPAVGSGTVSMTMEFRVEQVNDPTLTIDLPTNG